MKMILIKKCGFLKDYFQTSTTSTLLVTAVPAMTTTAASAGDYVTFSYLPKKSESYRKSDLKLKLLICSGTSNASDGGVAITTWRHLNIVDPLH